MEDHLSLLDIAEEKHPGWLRARGGAPIKARLEGLPTGATFAETKSYLRDAFTTGREKVQAKIRFDNLAEKGRSYQDVEIEARTLARKAGFPLESREVMVFSTLSRLVRQANPYVSSQMDDKTFDRPG